MTCCSIAAGCGIPVTGCTGTSVASGHVLVDLSVGQMPLYVDICTGSIYYFDGTKWIVLGKDNKYLLYDAASRVLTLQPDGSSVQLPLASSTIAGLVKVNKGSPISITTDGTLVIDCNALKAACNLLDKSSVPTGNVIYYNTTTNMLDVDCAKLKAQCGLLDKSNAPSGNVIYYNPTTNVLDINCAALKAQCNLDTVGQIPSYNFGQQASLNGTVLHIANAQDPAAGVDVDLSSLVGSSGQGGGAENYLALIPTGTGNPIYSQVGVQVRTKYGTLRSIEIVANKVWNGFTGAFLPAGNHPTPPVDGDTRTPMDLTQLAGFPGGQGNNGRAGSLYCKIFEGGIILHYSNGSVTNTDVCGAPYGLKTCGFSS